MTGESESPMSTELDAESKLRLNWKECCGTHPANSAIGPHGGCECECHKRPDLLAEIERLQGLLMSCGLCQACLGNPMIQKCEPWCKEAQSLRKAAEKVRPT